MKKKVFLLVIIFLLGSLIGCNSNKHVTNQKENKLYLIGEWKVTDGEDTWIEVWEEEGSILFENGETTSWRLKGESEPNNSLFWRANVKPKENSQTYFQVIDDADFIKYIVTPQDNNTYEVITEVAFSGVTNTFIYEPCK